MSACMSALRLALLAPLAAHDSSLAVGNCNFHDSKQLGPASAVKIACVGDSITAGDHASDKAYTYPSQLQGFLDQIYGVDVYSVTNLGHCGATMLKAGNNPYNRTGQYRTLTSNAWDIVVIMLGTNDAKDVSSSHNKFDNWQHDCGGPADTMLTGCSFASDYADMIQVVRGLGITLNGPKIYAAIPPPLMRQGDYGMNQTVINSVYPNLFPLIQQDVGVFDLVDVFTGMGGIKDWQSLYPEDGCLENATTQPKSCQWFCDGQSCDQCHPNDNGYEQLAKIVQAGLGLDAIVSV